MKKSEERKKKSTTLRAMRITEKPSWTKME